MKKKHTILMVLTYICIGSGILYIVLIYPATDMPMMRGYFKYNEIRQDALTHNKIKNIEFYYKRPDGVTRKTVSENDLIDIKEFLSNSKINTKSTHYVGDYIGLVYFEDQPPMVMLLGKEEDVIFTAVPL